MNISTSLLSNGMIILCGAIMNFIFNNAAAGWTLAGGFLVVLIVWLIVYRKETIKEDGK